MIIKKVLTLIRRIGRAEKKIKIIGLNSYLKYNLSPRGSLIRVKINDRLIHVRSKTPDLEVAITSLCGEFESLRYILDNTFDGYIVDGGAYIGTSVIALKDLYPKASIIAIEPSSDNLKILKKNLAGLNNIQVIEGALVGKKSKDVKLVDRNTGEWGFSVVVDSSHSTDTSSIRLIDKVTSYTIDEIVDMPENIGILKLDIEGAEHELFRFAEDRLKKINVIVIELHDRIIKGCSDLFFKFSKNDRHVIKDNYEKYISIKK